MREMKDSGVEWIGEIPSDWKTARIKQLFTFGKGLPITKDNLVENGVSVISYGQIHSKSNDGIHIQDDLIRYVDKAFLTTNSKSLVKEGDFIFADTSEDIDGCGNCIYIDRELLLFAGYHTIIFSAEQKGDNRYLGYLFKTDAWRSQIRKQVTGVKLFSISRRILSDVSVIMPQEIGERIRIADYLDDKCAKINSIIEKQQVILEKLKEYKLSIITESVTKGLSHFVDVKSSGVDAIGDIPIHWGCTKLRYLHHGLTDGTHGTFERLESGRLLLSSKNVRDEGLIISDNESYISEEDYQNIVAKGFPKKKDVLLCCIGASIGRCVLYEFDDPIAFQRSVIMIRPGNHVNPEFLLYSMQSKSTIVQEQLLVNQSAQPGLYQGLVSEIYLTVPPLDEQNVIADFLKSSINKIDIQTKKRTDMILELGNFKKALIYEVVTGKMKV